jgi:hypothetical protein
MTVASSNQILGVEETQLVNNLMEEEGCNIMSARPFFPHEAEDPDLDWLVSNFLQERPNFIPVEAGSLPIILLPYRGKYEIAKQENALNPLRNSAPISASMTDEPLFEED